MTLEIIFFSKKKTKLLPNYAIFFSFLLVNWSYQKEVVFHSIVVQKKLKENIF